LISIYHEIHSTHPYITKNKDVFTEKSQKHKQIRSIFHKNPFWKHSQSPFPKFPRGLSIKSFGFDLHPEKELVL